jgi:hypothetical protein
MPAGQGGGAGYERRVPQGAPGREQFVGLRPLIVNGEIFEAVTGQENRQFGKLHRQNHAGNTLTNRPVFRTRLAVAGRLTIPLAPARVEAWQAAASPGEETARISAPATGKAGPFSLTSERRQV